MYPCTDFSQAVLKYSQTKILGRVIDLQNNELFASALTIRAAAFGYALLLFIFH